MINSSLFPNASPERVKIEVAIIALLGVVVGYLLKYYLEKKQAFSSDNAKIKRKMYEKFLDGMHKTTKKFSKLDGTPTQKFIDDVRKEFGDLTAEFYNTSILYGSSKVIRRYADFVRYTDKPQTEEYQYELMLKSSRLYKAMRKDIGLNNWWLGKDGELLLRGNINDYDTTIREYVMWHRRFKRWSKTRLKQLLHRDK
jgi:hypothetical protein